MWRDRCDTKKVRFAPRANPYAMESIYKIPLQAAKAEFTEKKSRFISYISPAFSEDEALAFLRSIREKHREATHNVYAYRIKNSGVSRHSDDGEPSGTAGMPLLDVFIRREIYDFCCVVTRYFGGVLLGAGGLIRAYARCAAEALEASGIGEMRETAVCQATVPYASYESVKRLLISCEAEITTEDFGADVNFQFLLDSSKLQLLTDRITELTAGAISIRVERNEMRIREKVPR